MNHDVDECRTEIVALSHLTNRRHLGIKLGLTPVIISGAVVVGAFSGGFIGVNIFLLSGAPNIGFSDLAALAAGGLLGGSGGLGITGTTSTLNLINL